MHLGRFAVRRMTLAVAALAWATFAPTMAAAAEPPTYRTIAPIQARPKRGEMQYRGNVQPMPAQPYAWGWFGARPRSNAAWQRGYYGDLRFWSRTGW